MSARWMVPLPAGPLAWMAVVAAIATGGGCGGPKVDYSKVDLVPVQGVVTMDGQPLADVTVVFVDESGSFSQGRTDAAGAYVLQFDSVKSGVTPGSKVVRITSRPVGEEEQGAQAEREGAAASDPERIPSRYNRKTTLKADVSAANRRHDFALTSK